MGIKEVILSLGTTFDYPVLLTEELHQVYAVSGYKRKVLTDLLNAFGRLSYTLELSYPLIHPPEWNLKAAGRLQTHVELPATIQLRLIPVVGNDVPDTISKITHDQAIQAGSTFLKHKSAKLYEQYPDDAAAICEFFGRLFHYYDGLKTWEWYVCPKSGTSLNLHLQPSGFFNPNLFIAAQRECSVARINSIVVYPYTIEIIFRAFSQIEHLPYNRKHRTRFKPY